MVYKDIVCLMNNLKITYIWIFFIDISKLSFKTVIFHNKNNLPFLLDNSVHMIKHHLVLCKLKFVSEPQHLNYNEHCGAYVVS